MAKIKSEDIKIVVLNPEAIPIAEERLTKLLYDKYIEEMAKNKLQEEYISAKGRENKKS